MSYITIVCPYCKKELFMPEDAKDVVCMYCAKPIDVQKIRTQQLRDLQNKSNLNADSYKLLDDAITALPSNIVRSVHEYGKFSISNYEEHFPIYKKSLEKSVKLASIAYEIDNSAACTYADRLFNVVNDYIKNFGIKKESSGKMFDVQYFMVTYFIPAILDIDEPPCSTIVDTFIDNWNKVHQNSKIKRCTYKEIHEGFRFKNKWCFITTATCNTLNKPDNCHELNTFRNFRDRYSKLSEQNKREMLFYYTIAPAIVSKINCRSNKDEIYKYIWYTYLSPCMDLLESDNDIDCAKLYKKMVTNLQNQFLS